VQYLHENKVRNILYKRAVKKNTLNVQILHDNRSHSSHKENAQSGAATGAVVYSRRAGWIGALDGAATITEYR
jgi:hypothetical protein